MLPFDVLAVTDPLAWVVVALFGGGALAERRYPDLSRYVVGGTWALFAVFWLLLAPHFFFVSNSIIEALLALVGVPACLYAGYLLASGRDSLFVLSRAVAVMGLVYLPAETLPFIRQLLVEHVASQTALLMDALGYDPNLGPIAERRPAYAGFEAAFFFETPDPNHAGIVYNIVMACTALGSMAIFIGCIAAVKAPLRRKFRALAVAIPIIYVLNIIRTTFIGLAFGHQWFDGWYGPYLLSLFGETDPYLVSHIVAEGIISQTLSVVALVGIAWFVIRELPELLVIIDDIAYMVTGEDRDTAAELGLLPDADDATAAAGADDD
ncbi:archaeosortase A [Natronomonas halophila]|uniref:archaeosortase A n=1 Tax=Natronomonas halophila TaxID=2747817 RepID=UPI0015B61178|nr:archaeosortase A [Natronomonas halophila]QLD84955.1 archaeosortase A [Natronomonas halophila]